MDIKQYVYESTLYIHENYDEPICVADISAQAYLSPSYFATVFRIFTGFTVKNYLNRYRLYRAALELAGSSSRIIEIVFATGFTSQQAFTKSFSQAYGITPAQFRLLKPQLKPFPPKNLWKEQSSMELMDCFDNVKIIHKNAFFIAGLEVDINYNSEKGTAPIGGAWDLWNNGKLSEMISDQTAKGNTYGITHSETAESTAKYTVCVEVSTLDNLPVGLVGRKFDSSEYAVFKTNLDIIWTGMFWKTFYTKWLPESGYAMNDEQFRKSYATFSKYPAIEMYDKNWKDSKSIVYIYAPIVKK